MSLDWFTATLRDNTTKKTTTLVPHTCRIDNAFQPVTAKVTAGHSYTLTLTNVDATYTYVDDVATS